MRFISTFFVVLLLQAFSLQAQEEQIYISYDFYFVHHTGTFKINSFTNNKESLQTIVRNFNLQTAPGVVENITTKRHIYLDLVQQKTTYWEEFDDVYVSESLNTMKWDLTGKTEKLLNYTCYEAKSTWKGRDYIAYFTTELPFKASPWKFHGLPGVMLKIKTNDDNIIIKATSLKIDKNLGEITNPFEDEKTLTLNDFIEIYKIRALKWQELANKMSARAGKKYTRFSGRIDLITEDDVKSEKEYDAYIAEYKKQH